MHYTPLRKLYQVEDVNSTGLSSFKNLADFLGFEGSFPCSERLQTAPTGAGRLKSGEKTEN